MEEKEFVCKFCNKKFPSGKSLGGHLRIHSPNKKKKKNNKKRKLVDQREITPLKQHQCSVCGKRFCSVKALYNHMDCHEKMAMDTQSTTTSSVPTMMKRSDAESFSRIVSSSTDPEIVQGAKDLMFLHLGRKGYNLAVKNSLVPDSSVAVDDSDDDSDNSASDSDSSDDDDDDYFMNGTKKSDSDISHVGGSLRNSTGVGFGFFNSFSNGHGDELRNKEGGGSKHDELSKSKKVSPFYESDSSADTNSKKAHRSREGMVKKASGVNKSSKAGYVCPICFKVYSSAQALGGHKRSHNVVNQQHRITHKAADMQFSLNLPAEDDDDD